MEQNTQAGLPEGNAANAPETELHVEGAAPPHDGVAGNEQQPEQVEQAQQPEQKPTRFDRRISDLLRENRQKAEEAAYWRGKAEARNAGIPQTPELAEPAKANPDAEPDPTAYALGEFDPAYIRDLARHTVRQERLEADRQAQEAAAFEAGKQRFFAAYEATLEAGFEAGAEFLVDIARERDLADAIAEAEDPGVAAQYIALNPADWQRVSRMSPTQRAVQIDRITQTVRARLAQGSQQGRQNAPAAPQNNAPAQPTPALQATPTISGRGAGPAFNPETASLLEFEQRLLALRQAR